MKILTISETVLNSRIWLVSRGVDVDIRKVASGKQSRIPKDLPHLLDEVVAIYLTSAQYTIFSVNPLTKFTGMVDRY